MKALENSVSSLNCVEFLHFELVQFVTSIAEFRAEHPKYTYICLNR
jgi:hypothetical protein